MTTSIEEDGDHVLILVNADEQVIKPQLVLCEEEKRKLIVNVHVWTVWQMTWTAIANSVPTDPFPKNPVCGIQSLNFDIVHRSNVDERIEIETAASLPCTLMPLPQASHPFLTWERGCSIGAN